MIHAADIREWRDRNVVDPKGHKIGVLEAIYVDTTTDEPAMATVRTGLPTRHQLAFVPLDEGILGPDYVKVSYAKALVKKAPSVGRTTSCPPGQRKRSSGTTTCRTSRARAARGNSRAADRPTLRPKEASASCLSSCSSPWWPSCWESSARWQRGWATC